ncbi:hypothetical protein MAE30S32_19120 [Microcystis aeruginosa 11-30S32]|uniref:Uncharacterized protein n=1 Tax=Microcystis aeruginosa 11-30S32 TaxID=2358142 RepID=A0A510PHT2_MICAE|nr:hypothetical protein MAE30S32_19120 [Microcystis aeruginosa 11-30S32]
MFGKIRTCNRVARVITVNNGFLKIEIVEPTGNIVKASICITIFVDETIVFDVKANMIESIGYGID